MTVEPYFRSCIDYCSPLIEQNFESTSDNCIGRFSIVTEFFLGALSAIPDTIGAGIMAGAAIGTLGKNRRINKTMANEFQAASMILPIISLSVLRLNPCYQELPNPPSPLSKRFGRLLGTHMSKLNAAGKSLQARATILCALPVQLIASVADLAIGLVALAFSYLTLGCFPQINDRATTGLIMPTVIIFTVISTVIGVLNPEALKDFLPPYD